MPAHGAQRGPPAAAGGPGSSRWRPQPGQIPWVRVAVVKQGPQTGPSGHVARVLPAFRPHRAQVAVPVVRGLPSLVLRGVSPSGDSVVIVDDAGPSRADGAVQVNDVGGAGSGFAGADVGGCDGDEV